MTAAIDRRFLLVAGSGLAALASTLSYVRRLPSAGSSAQDYVAASQMATATQQLHFTDAQWRKRLNPNAYNVLRMGREEPPFSSALNAETRAGRYACAGCRLTLFVSDTKYDSGVGLPSFEHAVPLATVTKHKLRDGVARRLLYCANCDGFLGQAFHDGPGLSEMRYSPNGTAMEFSAA